MIPGLGLGFAASAPAQHNPWAGQQADHWVSSSQPPQAAGQSHNHGPPGALDSKPPANIDVGPGTVEYGSEEGEISERENEDLYDPRQAGRPAAANDTQAWPQAGAGRGFDIHMMDRQDAPAAVGKPSPRAAHAEMNWSTNQPGLACAARERSGSYSPYLSPREMGNIDSKRVSTEQASHEVSSISDNQPSSNHVVDFPRLDDTTAPSPVKAVGTAKQEARDAILGLWPLNVRHQNFLEEGIDSTILGGLLNELGLEAQENSQMSQDTASKDVTMLETPAPPTGQGSNASTVVAIPSRPGHAEPAKPVDKSEERKGRIAWLLAAKGSKPPTPATASVAILASTPTAAPPRLTQHPPKSQSEKSKFLQQKMDALRKSRKILARIRSQQQAPVSSMEDEAEAEQPLIPDIAPAEFNASEEPPSVQESSTQEPGSAKPSPSIPGLFLSSTPQLSHQIESSQQRRPTPVSGDPLARSIRRPFGQQMESRPFFINVSDDEDDAEMDIDSPDRTSSPANHPETSSQSAAAVLRESSSTVNNMMPRHAITPASAATPPRSSGNSGREDLANMNKKIEAMKRRIAEAEARKKKKLLRRASPAISHLDDSSRGGSVEAASIPRGVAAPSLAGRSHTPVNKDNNNRIESAPATMPQERPGRSRKKGHVYGSNRRSLYTAASERLPLIEARRREQLLKLQSLQMQIAKVEQAIAEGMREEQNLKDLVSDDSDRDESRAAPPTAPFSAIGSPEGYSVSYANTLVKAPEVNMAWKSQEPTTPEHENGATGRVEAQAATSAGHSAVTLHQPNILGAHPEHRDVLMKEADDCAGPDSQEGSDDYEPPDADPSGTQEPPSPSLRLQSASKKHVLPQFAESAVKYFSMPAATAQRGPASGQKEKGDESTRPQLGHELPESALQQSQGSTSESTQLQFVPYETPLQYFRAFRFHPEFGKSVTGGLRSLTYSNKIDVQREVCPDELAGQACPRGNECGYQHFDNIKAPNEQIFLQLGAAGNYPAEQKQEYIAGLRQLLTDFRNRKVKDFDTISRGIVDYRAQFLKDRSKILPLGGVTI